MVPWLGVFIAGLSVALLGAAAALAAVVVLGVAMARGRPRSAGRRGLRAALGALVGGLATAALALAWGRSPPALAVLDVVALSIPRDAARARSPDPRWQILAGDMHCHAWPWDGLPHAARDLDATVRLARAEGVDFVVLVPHLWWTHWPMPWAADHHRALHRDVRAALAARSSPDLLLLPGFEYTDDRGGHAGLAFGDAEAALDAYARSGEPSAFFRAYAASGGLVTIHHPFLTPIATRLPQPPDISWRPFSAPGAPVDPAVATLDGLATQVEAYNVGVSELRDRFALDDAEASLRRAFAQVDREARRGRRLTVTGGTDSHSSHLRAAMFVLAEARTAAGVREALAAGRTCVRASAACTFEASADGRTFGPPGTALERVDAVWVRARGARVEVLRDGVTAARPRGGEAVRVAVPLDRCTVLRARVDAGWSGPVYANCGPMRVGG